MNPNFLPDDMPTGDVKPPSIGGYVILILAIVLVLSVSIIWLIIM